MDFEQRNPRPQGSSNLPLIVLIVLIGIIAAMLFLGWKYNIAGNDEKLTNITPDSMEVALKQPDILDEATVEASPTKKAVDEEIVEEASAIKEKPKVEEKKIEQKKRETPKATLPTSSETTTHTIEAGETFYGVANRYNIKFSTLEKLNPDIKPEGIKSGVTKLKVPVQAVHIVGAGDILRVVAKKYGVTVEQIMTANKKTKNFAERGEKLIIPFGIKK